MLIASNRTVLSVKANCFTMTKKIQSYSAAFKAEAVKKIVDNNGNLSATARQLGVAMQTLFNWQNKTNQGKLIGTEQYVPEIIVALEEFK